MQFTSIISPLLALAVMTAAVPVAEEPILSTDLTGETSLIMSKRDNCALYVQWESNWPENGWRRYRVRAFATVGGNRLDRRQMLVAWKSEALGELISLYRSLLARIHIRINLSPRLQVRARCNSTKSIISTDKHQFQNSSYVAIQGSKI